MTKKNLDIPKDFSNSFNEKNYFKEFFNDLRQEGINQMLKAEMTDQFYLLSSVHFHNLYSIEF